MSYTLIVERRWESASKNNENLRTKENTEITKKTNYKL